ncbi:hypothetical protein [Bradyrhizobium genosp. A]|uniref:hypothetical protein n=1 Tax=Bradyrhizobium genosp. A TaxID=83626 RepID=UPI003CFA1BD6
MNPPATSLMLGDLAVVGIEKTLLRAFGYWSEAAHRVFSVGVTRFRLSEGRANRERAHPQRWGAIPEYGGIPFSVCNERRDERDLAPLQPDGP